MRTHKFTGKCNHGNQRLAYIIKQTENELIFLTDDGYDLNKLRRVKLYNDPSAMTHTVPPKNSHHFILSSAKMSSTSKQSLCG